MAMPFPSVISVDLLPAVEPLEGESPREFADRVQLIIANHLKVKAIDRSSDEIFRKPRNEKAKSE
jgi:hypothetical protein